jgi:nucleoside-diphosphate-sugar epimerase
MNHILLFGASGFLGARVRDALGQHGGVDRVICPGRDRCDLLDASVDEIGAVLREARPSAVINCTGRLDGSAAELVHANTLVTAKLIDAICATDAAGSGDRSIRFVRLGSAGEYGPVPHGRAVTETDPARPASDYGLSHLAATRLVEIAAAAGLVDGVTLRVFNPIGAGMREGNLLGRAAVLLRKALMAGSPSISMGPLSAYRDFVDARDVASAVVAAALSRDMTERVLNVGSGRAVSARTAVSVLAQTAGYAGEIHEEGAATPRSASVDWMLADAGRAADVLGWRPVYDLADSAKAIWADLVGTDVR